ncbi:MAG: transposase, partial [Trichodesmium sp. MO_231.B1]|nr:transposase [Trichodesmium sp. MO_231.B1]
MNRKNLKNKFNLGQINSQEIIAYFEGGKITSNGGIVLIAELDKKLKITEQFVKCFQDYRHPS